jgi:hypothetical protein
MKLTYILWNIWSIIYDKTRIQQTLEISLNMIWCIEEQKAFLQNNLFSWALCGCVYRNFSVPVLFRHPETIFSHFTDSLEKRGNLCDKDVNWRKYSVFIRRENVVTCRGDCRRGFRLDIGFLDHLYTRQVITGPPSWLATDYTPLYPRRQYSSILKCILTWCCVWVWTWFFWLRFWSIGGLCGVQYYNLKHHKAWWIFWLPERLSASLASSIIHDRRFTQFTGVITKVKSSL